MLGNSPTERTLSEPELNRQEEHKLEANYNYVTTRFKRKRDEEIASDLAQFKEEMRSMMVSLMETQLTEIRKNTDTLKEIRETNRNIESSIEYLSAQNDEFNKKIERLEKQATEDRKHITFLEDKVEEVLKNSRKSNFEIKNVPRKNNETKTDLTEIVLKLSQIIDCPMSRADIRDVYRIRGKQDGTQATPIIVETSSVILKNETLKMCKAFNTKHSEKLRAKHLGLRTSEETPVYVTEQLTPKAARLYYLAREVKRQNLYKFCWTAYGNVYLRKDENSQIVQITSEAQVHHLAKQL